MLHTVMLCINSVDIDSIECIRNPYVLYRQYQHTLIQCKTRHERYESV